MPELPYTLSCIADTLSIGALWPSSLHLRPFCKHEGLLARLTLLPRARSRIYFITWQLRATFRFEQLALSLPKSLQSVDIVAPLSHSVHLCKLLAIPLTRQCGLFR